MPSIIKVDQIQSDTGRVNVTSNLASVTISNNIEAPLKITTSYNEKVRLISATDAANEQQAIIGYNAGNYYWQLGAGKDSSNNPFVSIYTGTSGTSLSERLKVTGAGVVELLNGQLKFPATQNASSDPNTLDDYEEGTWTPTMDRSGSSPTVSYSQRYGTYTKIGRMVWVFWDITASSVSGGSGVATISGLPFYSNTDTSNGGYSVALWRDSSAVPTGSSNQQLKGFIQFSSVRPQYDNSATSGYGTAAEVTSWQSGRTTGYVVYQVF